jgi:branched-chain amino acid transport system permease protein
MDTFLQLLISGIATGAIYSLAAVGFALLWQTAGAINFAQGEFLMLPAFFMLAAMEFFGVGLIPGFLIVLPLMLLILGVLFKLLLVDRLLLKQGEFPLVIATIGLGLLLKEAVKLARGANALPFLPTLVEEQIFNIGGISVSLTDIVTFVVAVVFILALQLFLNHTFVGRSMEAVSQNPEAARILGINIDRMILYTFLINATLVTVASMLVTPSYFAKFSNGEPLGLFAFMAAIVGGFNQVRGALFGGFLIGIVDNLGAYYISADYRSAIALILLIGVILLKPEGLLGRIQERTI